MTWFFIIVRTYKALRAAVGIMIVLHGTYVWVRNKRQRRA